MNHTNTGKTYPGRKPELTIPEGGKPGQILVRTEKGLEWLDYTPLVTANITRKVVESETVYSCDKTYEELRSAWDAGRDIAIFVGDTCARVCSVDDDQMYFFGFFADGIAESVTELYQVVHIVRYSKLGLEVKTVGEI